MNVLGKILTVDRVLAAYAKTGLIPTYGSFSNTVAADRNGCAFTAVALAEVGEEIDLPLGGAMLANDTPHSTSFTHGFDGFRWRPTDSSYEAWRLGRECRIATGAVHHHSLVSA